MTPLLLEKMTFLTRYFFTRRTDDNPSTQQPSSSSITNELLSDPDSELAKFLLVPTSVSSAVSSQPPYSREEDHYVQNETTTTTTLPCIKSNRAWSYCLALESHSIRSDRIVMVYETYAIFAALFLGGTWVLYEWGSTLAYGGSGGGGQEIDAISRIMSTVFEPVMAIALGLNIQLAFFGSMMWIMSLHFSASNPKWAYSCRNMTAYMQVLFTFMLLFVTLGLILAVIAKFAPNIPTIMITIVLIGIAEIPGFYYVGKLLREEIPLELHHSSMWFKLAISPQSVLMKKGHSDLQQGAMRRAATLRKQFSVRLTNNNNGTVASSTSQRGRDSLEKLLEKAANSIGRSDIDISIYIARLEADLYTDSEHLSEEDVDELSRYMPRRLAKEVHKIMLAGG